MTEPRSGRGTLRTAAARTGAVKTAVVLNTAYVLPFALSATAVAGLAYLLGRVVPGDGIGRWVQAAILVYLAACDLRLGPLHTPGLNRQTRPGWRRVGILPATALWGLDIGTTVSTIKVTSLYWASFVLLLGLPEPPLQVAVACFAAGYLVAHLAAVVWSLSYRPYGLDVLAGGEVGRIRVSAGILLLLLGVFLGLGLLGG